MISHFFVKSRRLFLDLAEFPLEGPFLGLERRIVQSLKTEIVQRWTHVVLIKEKIVDVFDVDKRGFWISEV